MKWFVVFAFCICNFSCKKHSGDENYPIKATMRTSSGKLILARFLETETVFHKEQGTQGEQISITGLKKGAEYSLGLIIIRPSVGTFNLSGPGWLGTNCRASIPYPNNSYSSWGVGSGSITIESLTSSTITGRFNAICIEINDTLKITDGSFNGKFQ